MWYRRLVSGHFNEYESRQELSIGPDTDTSIPIENVIEYRYFSRICVENNLEIERRNIGGESTSGGVSGATTEKVSLSVKEGDSVTLQTDVNTNQHGRIRWYYDGTRIAEINRDPNKTCTDVQCKEGTERFRGRLKLDHQTGSLTVMNIRTTDAGDYDQIISGNNNDNSKKNFNVSVHGVSAAEQDEVKKEGENITLYTGVIKNPNDVITWYFNNILIAGDQSKTGSLTIMNITNTDSGRYQLQINSSRFSIVRNFTLTIPVVSPPSTAAGENAAVIGGAIVGGVLLIAVKENEEAEKFLPGPNDNHMNVFNGETAHHSNQQSASTPAT
ncbi:Carcinoembryonic antigen-related cell adhesion molecule 6 [Labeo rohita]|uniref:Carcinoembryonic antigen-related cell adhesion molecule 6 n=1 Tax=Labeo rohita TaxID=84645 RepID=A0ABQ8L8Y1_LABRO|nr:Carcinoembryonic antigen-related cell adhesion molecule 6 [Labeo rohita]